MPDVTNLLPYGNYVRILNPNKYQKEEGAWTSEVFRPLNGSISIFDVDCAEKRSATICNHIRQIYPTVCGGTEPVGILFINQDDMDYCKQHICAQAILRADPIPEDICHWGIFNLTKSQSRRFYKYLEKQPCHFFLCNGEELTPFSPQAFEELSK